MKTLYPPIIIKVENRLTYYNALNKAHTPEGYQVFIELVATGIETLLDFLSEV